MPSKKLRTELFACARCGKVRELTYSGGPKTYNQVAERLCTICRNISRTFREKVKINCVKCNVEFNIIKKIDEEIIHNKICNKCLKGSKNLFQYDVPCGKLFKSFTEGDRCKLGDACNNYDNCLDYVSKRNWKGWSVVC